MTKRYVSLDVLRGLTVAFMIIVNNPGSRSNVFLPLKHAAWDGCTPCDLVFPFFMFCVGTSMAFALAKYSSLTLQAAGKVFKRGALLYLVGLFLTAFPFYPAEMNPELSFWENWVNWAGELRILGVLQRIALCYVVGSLLVLWLRKPVKLICAALVMAATYVGLLVAFAGPEGAFTIEGNFARQVDLAVLGENHMYVMHGVVFDPEGLLGVLTGTCTIIIGYLVGMMIRSSSKRYSETADIQDAPVGVSARLFSLAAGALLLGLALDLVVPINKPLWSVSYVVYTAGWAMFVLALLIYLIDVKGWEKAFYPFKAFGMNALTMFVLSGLVMRIIRRFIEWDYTQIFGGSEGMSLLFSVLYLLPLLLIAIFLYKKKIFIKL